MFKKDVISFLRVILVNFYLREKFSGESVVYFVSFYWFGCFEFSVEGIIVLMEVDDDLIRVIVL